MLFPQSQPKKLRPKTSLQGGKMSLIRDLKRFLAPLQRRVMNLIIKGIVDSVDDSDELQKIKLTLLSDEVQSDLDRLQQFGLTSNPPKDSEALVLFLGGNRDHGVVIAVDSTVNRPTGLKTGEVAVYKDKSNFCIFKTNGDVVIENSGKILLGQNATIIPAPGIPGSDSVITQKDLNPITGTPSPTGSGKVLAAKT